MLIGAPKTRELIEVRHGLEVQAARQAAGAIGVEALEELSGHLAEMERRARCFARTRLCVWTVRSTALS